MTCSKNHKSKSLLTTALACVLLLSSCAGKVQTRARPATNLPPAILWAWERPENLEFLDPQRFGAAFLAQTLVLQNDEALASFCLGDHWLQELPVDEAVPRIFRVGAEDKAIKNSLTAGNDFRETQAKTLL